jgi:hypothetical protein
MRAMEDIRSSTDRSAEVGRRHAFQAMQFANASFARRMLDG